MNCKPGDLAIVVGCLTHPEFLGRLVRCLELNFHQARQMYFWRVDVELPPGIGGIADVSLCPIRDNDGEDETLQWAPVPVKELA